jgi:hypothetical protein
VRGGGEWAESAGPGPEPSRHAGERTRRGSMSGLESWARDIKHAARSLARAPMFSAVIVLTLDLR